MPKLGTIVLSSSKVEVLTFVNLYGSETERNVLIKNMRIQ